MFLVPLLSPAAMAIEAYSLSWYMRELFSLPTSERQR
jgi:hypothetical protein